MIAIVDCDSISFMLGWHHRDHRDIPTMHQAVDKFLEDLFILTGADMYYMALAGNTPCFRYDTYKVKPYKGSRKELDEHMQFWRPIVVDYLKNQYKADSHDGLEADDLVYTAAMALKKYSHDIIICSPDKDLRQIAGLHHDYRTGETFMVDEYQTHYNFFKLMLEGDTVDGIAGIPGMGEKKTAEKLKPLLEAQADRITYEELVKTLYYKHFGQYYGEIIYAETEKTISLVWDQQRKIEVHNVPQKKELHPFDQLSRAD